MFSSIPQLSAAFHLPYLQFLDSPHVSLYFQTTKRLCVSSLDLSALPSFIWSTAAPLSLFFLLPVCQSVSQAVSPIHKLLTLATVAHSQKLKREKKTTQGGISKGEKQKRRNRREQSVILGSVCEAAWLVWSLESGSLLCVAHVGRAREWEEGREGSSTALWRCRTTSFYSRVGSWKIIIPHPPPQHKFKRTV